VGSRVQACCGDTRKNAIDLAGRNLHDVPDEEAPVLELRPNCELCDVDLSPESRDARICTYECTFCASCVDGPLGGVCPNCGGNFERRPIRPPNELALHPASTVRVPKRR
jgi:hypothetical protein